MKSMVSQAGIAVVPGGHLSATSGCSGFLELQF